jgi:hypothetical protein
VPGAPGAPWGAVPGGAPVPQATAVAGWPTTRVAAPPAWPQGGWTASPWIATSAGLGWRPPSSGVGPFQPGDEVELLATSTWIWIAGVRVERYAREATLDAIGQDGLAITEGDAAVRRWVMLVPDVDDAVAWAIDELTVPAAPETDTPPAPSSEAFEAASLEPTDAQPAPALREAPSSLTPETEASTETATPPEDPRQAGPRWDDPRSVIDDGRR